MPAEFPLHLSTQIPDRKIAPGMGQAVAERTYLRPIANNPAAHIAELNPNDPHVQRWFQILNNAEVNVAFSEEAPFKGRAPEPGLDYSFENWAALSERVARGNWLLGGDNTSSDNHPYEAIRLGHWIPAGRHLQQGDAHQPFRSQTVFTNCATASSAWSRYYLLLNGSGVGRSLDDDILILDWDNAPAVQCVLDEKHPDYQWGGPFLSRQESEHRFGRGEKIHRHQVADSREGWAKSLEKWEMMAYTKRHRDELLILDFTDVRRKNAPIKGMQGRPSSGPVPTMLAFLKAAATRGSGMPRWKSTLFVEHYFSESVVMGGARRSSGLIEKFWKDPGILDFITVKMPVEYHGLTTQEIIEYRQANGRPMVTPLWSSNHSVGVDAEYFWLLSLKRGELGYSTPTARWARKVHRAIIETAYATGTGEPGIVRVDALNVTRSGLEGVWE
jgi:hypothetical protein